MFLAGCGSTGLSECRLEEQPVIPGHAPSLECFSYSVLRGKGSIRIEWTLAASAEGSVFSVQRAEDSRRAFRELRAIEAGLGDRSFVYFDLSCRPESSYRYRVVHRPACGASCVLFETAAYVATDIPTALHPGCPNPFTEVTILRFSVGERAKTSIAIYDVEGRLVRLLASSILEPGSYMAAWNGRDDAGRPAAAGVYFCLLKAGKETISRKLILVR